MTSARLNIGCFFGLVVVLLSSCAKEFLNPYDPATPADIWMPSDLTIDTLGRNALKLSWQQDELHIDGYLIRRDVSGRISEFIIPFDSLIFSDIMVVDSTVTDTCPAVVYSVMARAGDNLSTSITNTIPIHLPLTEPANAGDDITVTDTTTTVTLSASASSNGETGGWSIVSGEGGSFSDSNSPISSFTGQACEQYVLRWTVYGCVNSTDDVNVNFNNGLTVANAGSDQSFSDNTTQATLSANSPSIVETGLWTIVSGTGGNIADPTDTGSIFTGEACTTYILRWKITGCGESSDEVSVSFSEGTTQPDAGPDQSFTDNTTQTTLSANSPAADEIGQWSITSGSGGSIADPGSPTSTFIGNSCETYVLTWTINGDCGDLTDQVSISFQQETTQAAAGNDQTFADNTIQATISGNTPTSGETGQWSIISGSGGTIADPNSPSTSFSGQVCTTYVLRWTITSDCGSTSDDVSIQFQQQTSQANAGSDQSFTDNTTQVSISGNSPAPGETGQWSIVTGSGGIITNSNSPATTFNGQLCQQYTLRWTLSSCDTQVDDVTISFLPSVTQADAGDNITAGSGSVTLNGNQPESWESGQWTIISGSGGSLGNAMSPNSSLSGLPNQTYVLQWTINGCTSNSSDNVSVLFPLAIPGAGVTDIDGNAYETSIIGDQQWMAENLRTESYANGDPIELVESSSSWLSLSTGAYCYYNSNTSLQNEYGNLYNQYAVQDARNVCPTGWHVPTDEEWKTLEMYLGMSQAEANATGWRGSTEGGMMKTVGTSQWASPNLGATNDSELGIVPSGKRGNTGSDDSQSVYGYLWTSTTGHVRELYYNFQTVNRNANTSQNNGLAVRCIKD